MAVNKVVFGTETLIDLTGDTVAPEVLLAGYTAHNASGEPVEGDALIPNDVEAALTEKDVTVPDGARISDLAALISGIEVGGGGKFASGTFTPSSATQNVKITHNLGVIPNLYFVWTTTKPATGIRYLEWCFMSMIDITSTETTNSTAGVRYRISTTSSAGSVSWSLGNGKKLITGNGLASGTFVYSANTTTAKLSSYVASTSYSLFAAGLTYNWFCAQMDIV